MVVMDHFDDADGYRLMRNSAASCRFVFIPITYFELADTRSKPHRLNAQHYLWKETCGFNLHPRIPIPQNGEVRIADVGTGTGFARSMSPVLTEAVELTTNFHQHLDR